MDLKSVIDRFPNSGRKLAIARLRHRVIDILQISLKESGKSQTQLAEEMGFSRSAVNQIFVGDGNVRIATLADYLYGMGRELQLKTVPIGDSVSALEAPSKNEVPIAFSKSSPKIFGVTRARRARPVGEMGSEEMNVPWEAFAGWTNFERIVGLKPEVAGITDSHSLWAYRLPSAGSTRNIILSGQEIVNLENDNVGI